MISSVSLIQYNIKNYTSHSTIPSLQGDRSPVPSLSSSSQNSDHLSLHHLSPPKLGDTYTKSDVLLQLWKDTHSIDLNDPNSFAGLCFDPTEKDLADLEDQMKTQGLNGKINFDRISSEFSKVFSTVHAGNLGHAIEELASRVVALEGQVERTDPNQMQQVTQLLEQGKETLIGSYSSRLQDALGLSDTDAQAVRDSLHALIDQQLQTYRKTQAEMSNALSGTQDEWLLNQNQYMASQLRQSTGGLSDSMVGGKLSLGDLRATGEIAGAYQAICQEVSQGKGGHEAFLALDMGMIDMKTETLIQKGAISETMAGILRSSLEQRHENAMDLADQQLTFRREHALSGDGPIPNLQRDLFQSIYDVILDHFHDSGGDALSAIRNGVSFGKTATAQASQENPKVSRWGASMDHYWNNFYTSIETSDLYGHARLRKSEYQKYADSWQHFLSTLSNSTERFLLPSGQELPSYDHNLINTTA